MPAPEIIELESAELEALLERAEREEFEQEDYAKIRAVLAAYFHVTRLIGDKQTSLARLRKLLFGVTSEKTAALFGPTLAAELSAACGSDALESIAADESTASAAATPPVKEKKPGHGRLAADDYPGATRIFVSNQSLTAGDPCPVCPRGTVYKLSSPGVLVRFVGQAPLAATIYELEKLRCQLCGQIFTAAAPEGVGDRKYDESVSSMIGLLKYGGGLPFNRLERLQANLEVPLPASTQWERVEEAAPNMQPVFEELIRQAAGGDVLHNDDTTVKILEHMGKRAQQQQQQTLAAASVDSPNANTDADQRRAQPATSTAGGDERKAAKERTGLFTSGIVASRDGQRIALFFSGRKHAGENLQEVLQERAAELPPPIQMCDALSRNVSGELATIVANCLAHGRRQFVDLVDRFPEPCRYVLETLAIVYRHDAIAREQGMSADERLAFHQAHSGPVMAELKIWLARQIDEKLVEPNSGLGAAIAYLRKHWEKLTRFLHVAGAPLDNNLVERALKKAILHRKNSLFYKTQNGARVGDLYMSLIYTCELCGASPFDYLTQLQRHAAAAALAPQHWLPWNYRVALLAAAPSAVNTGSPATGDPPPSHPPP